MIVRVHGGTPGSGPLSISPISKLRSNDAVPGPGATGDLDARVIRHRRGLPGSRSVVGGLLVAVACLLTWWAAAGNTGKPTTRYVVAVRAIGPGERLDPDDLTLHAVDLSGDLGRSAFTSPDSLEGAVALGPIGPGELVQARSVTHDAAEAPESELTFPVASTWAVGGRLRAGDRIDVFATYGNGERSQTTLVLQGAVIRRIDDAAADRLRPSDEQTITVGLGAEVAVADVVDAAQTADLTIVRTTGEDRPR